MNEYQDRIATHIIKEGYTIFGGYVYKRLVNGDQTSDIDVKVNNYKEILNLQNDLLNTFGCIKINKRNFIDYNTNTNEPSVTLNCGQSQYVDICTKQFVDIITKQDSKIFKLEYKNFKISNNDGNNIEAQDTIKNLKLRIPMSVTLEALLI